MFLERHKFSTPRFRLKVATVSYVRRRFIAEHVFGSFGSVSSLCRSSNLRSPIMHLRACSSMLHHAFIQVFSRLRLLLGLIGERFIFPTRHGQGIHQLR